MADADLGPSAGGRAPRNLAFVADRGQLLLIAFGLSNATVAIADLAGNVISSHHEEWDIASGPDATLEHVASALESMKGFDAQRVWGVAMGAPGPTDFLRGRLVAPPNLPSWNEYDIRGWLQTRFHAPVWVDNYVNVLAIGELKRHPAVQGENMLYVRVGTGIGEGLIFGGQMIRGGNGAAGNIAHTPVPGSRVPCRCGKFGCLEAVAGGWALVRDATDLAVSGRSQWFAERLEAAGRLRSEDIIQAAKEGDSAAIELLGVSARAVGDTVALLVNHLNPSLIVLGGSIAASNEFYLAAIREAVYRSGLPLATRDLTIAVGAGDPISGAASLLVDQLFEQTFPAWVLAGSPINNNAVELAG
ncbi:MULTISPECIES: ROK family protein [unclassified Arthrobacter]|uniref:ROK family protein n=1 Tax=unclassified Arthrobacter TaxID=235627 RepID=UPI001C85E430|nr:ROK family protein [Arthrobacter sp. MAHUQ-56]MBX7445920.1 ROK family protein [Arthrobacter sp. MAHUQ-56]